MVASTMLAMHEYGIHTSVISSPQKQNGKVGLWQWSLVNLDVDLSPSKRHTSIFSLKLHETMLTLGQVS